MKYWINTTLPFNRANPKIVSLLWLSLIFLAPAWGQSVKIAGKVYDQFGSLPGAKVAVEGSTLSTSTDVNGSFMMEIDPGTYNIVAGFVMYNNQIQQVNVAAGDSIYLDFQLESGFSIDQEVNVGTRFTPRALQETTVPIDIISNATLSASPQVELGQILHYSAASFHSTRQTIADGTDYIDPATLRGLGPDQVLVLINGKRRHISSLLNVNGTVGRGSVGTDFNAIPAGAVDRIEILRDGAAAQYGSDAIAGVVNIVLKERTGVTTVDGGYGVNELSDGSTKFFYGNGGFDIGEGGHVNMTLEFRDRGAVNRAGNYAGPVYFNENQGADELLISQRDFFAQTGYDNQRVMSIGSAATRNQSVFFNMDIPINHVTHFYGHGGVNFRQGKGRGFYRFPKDSIRVVAELYPDGFSPGLRTDIRDDAITLGFRGLKNTWNLDLSNTIGRNGLDFNVENSNNASLGQASPTDFYSGGFIYAQNTTNFDAFRTFNALKGINVAFGAEMRIERYEIIKGEETSYVNGLDSVQVGTALVPAAAGAQVFPGFQSDNALEEFRTNNAWYLEVESKLNSAFLLGTALRYEVYSDFGDQLTWKLSGRYKLGENYSLSGGLSTGFRAPSLHQFYFNNVGTQFVNSNPLRVGTFNNESTVARAFGIGDLKPELSDHISLGFIGKPTAEFTIKVDFYDIRIRDRIVLSGRFDEGYEAILGPLGVGAAQFFTNAVDTRTTGVDVVLNYRLKMPQYEFFSLLSGNWTSTRLDGDVQAGGALAGEEEILFNREEISRVEVAQPNFKIISQNNLKYQKFSFDANLTFFGRVEYIHPDDGNPVNWTENSFNGFVESRDQVFDPKLITDLSAAYQFSDNFRFLIGGHNIMDVYPDEHAHSGNTSHGSFRFSRRVQQFGVNGRHWFMKMTLSF